MNSNKDQDFKQLVQKVLNEEFLLGLQGGVRLSINGRTQEFDLADNKKNYYIEIKLNSLSVNRPHVLNEIQTHIAFLSTRTNKKPFKYILVFNYIVSDNDREYFKSSLNIASTDFFLFDLDNIIELAKKHSINILEFGIPDKSYPNSLNEKIRNDQETEKTQSKSKEKLQSNNNSAQNQALSFLEFAKKHDIDFFIVQSRFNNRDYSFDWKRNQKWEFQEKGANPVSKNDILFMNSGISVSNNFAVMSIGLVGHVFENNNCNVDWADFEGKEINAFKEDDKDTVKNITSENYLFDIIKESFDFHPSLKTRLEDEILKQLNWERSKREVHIDKNYNFSIGLEVGIEIRNYDVIFLPKSSHGGIGQNGIAAHIIKLLDRNRSEIEFTSRDLEEIGYKWISVYTETKSIEVCFIVSKDIDKNSLDFTDNLKNAIYNYSPAMGSLNSPSDETKIFIPLLGTGQAQLPIADSFNIINEVLPIFKDYFKNPQIRINFPQDIIKADLRNYADVLITSHQLKKVDDLNKKFSLLYGEDVQDEESKIEKTKDKIPFHLDNVETLDKLNREPVAQSLARLINKDIFDQEEMNHSFMVHLQGEWGSGKSTFLNLIENHLDNEKRNWKVIKFNAWQNQHISPPWWSFIDQIYRQSLRNQKWFKIIYLFLRENYRRIIRYSSAFKAFTFTITILLLLLLFNYGYNITNLVKKVINPNDSSPAETFKLTDLSEMLVTFSVIIGIIIGVAKFFSTPILMNSAEDARSFLKRATNPMDKIKKHFNSLISDINFLKYDVAVFIDDIDRCNRQYTVELLEGIQTLFKNKKVLYIVAGDTKWITSCFENNYEEFSKVAELQGQNLGELFLEKAFQLSVRMPDVSEESKHAYWKEIIGDNSKNEAELNAVKEIITDKQKGKIKERLVQNYNQNENNLEEQSNIVEEYNITRQQATELTIEGLDENFEDVRHLLMSFHNLISPNPRSIKRLANNYSMYRNTLIAEQAKFKPGHLFRWLLLEDKYPIIVKYFLEKNTLDTLPEYIESKGGFTEAQITDINDILIGRDGINEEELKIEELNQILRK